MRHRFTAPNRQPFITNKPPRWFIKRPLKWCINIRNLFIHRWWFRPRLPITTRCGQRSRWVSGWALCLAAGAMGTGGTLVMAGVGTVAVTAKSPD